eukprot:scaffold898_cov15-Tisochrysis_lutea.AAC.1
MVDMLQQQHVPTPSCAGSVSMTGIQQQQQQAPTPSCAASVSMAGMQHQQLAPPAEDLPSPSLIAMAEVQHTQGAAAAAAATPADSTAPPLADAISLTMQSPSQQQQQLQQQGWHGDKGRDETPKRKGGLGQRGGRGPQSPERGCGVEDSASFARSSFAGPCACGLLRACVIHLGWGRTAPAFLSGPASHAGPYSRKCDSEAQMVAQWYMCM